MIKQFCDLCGQPALEGQLTDQASFQVTDRDRKLIAETRISFSDTKGMPIDLCLRCAIVAVEKLVQRKKP